MAEMFKVNAPVRKPLFEGVQGENEARSIVFDITPWVEELGDGAVTATAKRSQDSQPYPVTVTKDGNVVTWKPTSTDTAYAGVGSFQLEYTVDSVLAKTCIWSTMVAPSLDPAGDPPDPYDNWLAEMREIEANAIQAAEDAEDSADAAAASAASIAGDHDELINIRVGVDGAVYPSAGDAVREQIGVFDQFVNVIRGKNRCNNQFVPGYLKPDGSIAIYGNWVTTDYCYVKDFENVVASGTENNARALVNMQFICTYDSSKTFIEQLYTQTPNYVTIDDDVAYIRFCFDGTRFTDILVEEGTTRSVSYIPYVPDSEMLNTNKWTGKKWVVFGDSLTEENIRTTKHYFDYVADATGIATYNMGDGGSGYANEQNVGTAFYQRISSVPRDADVITIFGSLNDYSAYTGGVQLGTATDNGTTTLGGCINKTLDNLYAVVPLANVGIVSPTPWASMNPFDGSYFAEDYITLLKNICARRNVPFLDLYHCSGLRPWDATFRSLAYSKDGGNGTHPDETGHAIIAPRFKAFLESMLI